MISLKPVTPLYASLGSTPNPSKALPGADGTATSSGYQNTLDIIAGDALGVDAGKIENV